MKASGVVLNYCFIYCYLVSILCNKSNFRSICLTSITQPVRHHRTREGIYKIKAINICILQPVHMNYQNEYGDNLQGKRNAKYSLRNE